jgi:type IV secretory pathway TrbL component
VLVVVGSVVVGSVLVVVASVVVVGVVVVGPVVVGPVVVGPVVVVGAVAEGWAVVAPKAENASVMVVGPAVAGAWALAAPAVVVGRLPASSPVSGVGVDEAGKVVGARGPVVGVDADLGAGSAGTVGSARAGARRSGDGWGSRVAEATRAARTPVVSPKATSPSLQGHRGVVRCRGGGVRCRGGGVDMVPCPGSTSFQGLRPTPLGALPGRIPLRRWPHSP